MCSSDLRFFHRAGPDRLQQTGNQQEQPRKTYSWVQDGHVDSLVSLNSEQVWRLRQRTGQCAAGKQYYVRDAGHANCLWLDALKSALAARCAEA